MKRILLAVGTALLALLAQAEELGSVTTNFRALTPNDKIVVEAFDDPKVPGVTCYLSRAKTGGALSVIHMATDKTEASIACRQVGEISVNGPLPPQEDIFSERMSLVFKELHVVRMVDPKRNVLVYMTYSDKLVDGSPKNSVTAVPVATKLTVR